MRKIAVKAIVTGVCIVLACVISVSVIRVKPNGYLSYIPETEYETGSVWSASNEAEFQGMKYVCSDDTLSLYINEKTTVVAVLDSNSGAVWYSNPIDLSEDLIASPAEKSLLSSQISVTYFDNDRNSATKENYTESIEREQFKLEKINNGIRIIYTMGDFSRNIDYLPKYIKSERLKELVINKLSVTDGAYVLSKYFESEEKPGFLQRADAIETSVFITNKMIALFESAGYTELDSAQDAEMAGIEIKETRPFFEVPLEYRLSDGVLKASIPVEKIQKPEGFEITAIRFLNFFGSANNAASGYIMVPNGSGSLITLNNGKNTAATYLQQVYGIDPLAISRVGNENTQTARMPVFGLKNGNNAFLAIIEEGDAFASVTADVSGKSNSYNTVGTIFNIKSTEKLSMMGVTGDMSNTPMVESGQYKGRITVAYHFLNGENANYSGMAAVYREYLVDKYEMKQLEDGNTPSLFIDVIGTVGISDRIVGVPYEKKVSLTTVEQAKDLVNGFIKKGINNINLRYVGWANGGIYHNSMKSINIDNKNGSKKQLEELEKLLSKNNSKLFLDTAFLRVYKSSELHGYNKRKESSRYITGSEVLMSEFNPATMRMSSSASDGAYYILSPAYLEDYVDSFLKKFGKYKLSGVSLRDMGDILTSDKDKSAVINREQTKYIIQNELKKYDSNVENIMLLGGNIYAAVYADAIIEAPVYANEYMIIDADIPFYQMVMHGYVDYSGNAINDYSTRDTTEAFLKAVEYGCSLRYVLTGEGDELLKESNLNYSQTQYNNVADDIAELQLRINEVFDGLCDLTISEHRIINESLRAVTYQDGTVIYVNYADAPVSADGNEIEAKNFKVIKTEN